jgi:hypothetical protein
MEQNQALFVLLEWSRETHAICGERETGMYTHGCRFCAAGEMPGFFTDLLKGHIKKSLQ